MFCSFLSWALRTIWKFVEFFYLKGKYIDSIFLFTSKEFKQSLSDVILCLFFSLISNFLFMQQIQYGRRSLKPLRRLKTQPASCLLSQTGLRCHGNMLWRSTYWDSAGWQVTVLAVRVFGPLSPTNILLSLRTCNTQQSTEQSRSAFVSAWIYFVYVYWSVCLCLQQKCYPKDFLIW